MVITVVAVFGVALLAPWLRRLAGRHVGWFLALLPAGLTAYFASFAAHIANAGAVSQRYDWVPSLGVSLSFYLDGLSLLFALLICGIGTLVVIYAGGYLAQHPDLGRFYSSLFLFMGSMLGLVLADNAITVFVFWELTSISSYLLIGFDHERAESRSAALQALLVTNAGGLAMLAGIVLMGQVGGTTELSALSEMGDRIRGDGLYLPILLLILAGAFTKSAQFPFHFWLPRAMAAPTPVSAYLHSATMVKAGVYLLARLSPILGGTEAWGILVPAAGAVTMLVGGVLAFQQTDLKRILAYSTVSALGSLVLMLGLGTPFAVTAALEFVLAHALYKGALFMVAGSIEHESGTRDVERLGGLRSLMPLTALIGVLAAISMAGFGPVLGFIGKELLLEAALEYEDLRWILVPAVVLAGSFFVAAAGLVSVTPFFGERRTTQKHPHEAPLSMWLGPAVLAALGVIAAIVSEVMDHFLVSPSTASVLGTPSGISLALWHGFNTALLSSIVSVTLGVGLYLGWRAMRQRTAWLEIVGRWGPARGYSFLLAGLDLVARAQTRLLQNGYLRVYLAITFCVATALGGYTLVSRVDLGRVLTGWDDLRFYDVGLGVLMLLAAAFATLAVSRLAAVAALSVVGFGVALVYIQFGAPDLAMTQFMIETLTVILFVLVFYHLPGMRSLSSGLARARDAVLALGVGGFVTVLVLAASGNRTDSRLAGYFAEQSVPLGHGHNIVNVILVDFRALDTMGEITVLAVAAFGVFALLRLRPGGRDLISTHRVVTRLVKGASGAESNRRAPRRLPPTDGGRA